MRITPVSWLIVLAGALVFGGGIVGLARVLPSSDAPARHASIGPAQPPSLDPAPALPEAAATATPMAGLPPASAPLASAQPLLALDFHPLDPGRRDRYGNPAKRAATAAELASIAATYDVVVDDLRWQPDGAPLDPAQIAAMKSANPRLRVLRYVGGLTNNDGPIFDIAPHQESHGPWFLRDGSADFVRAYAEVAPWNGSPSYVFDPASTDVRNALGAWARQLEKLGYDGVLLDGVSACVPAPGSSCADALLLSHPLNKTTNRPYTDEAWLADTAALLQVIRHAAPMTQIYLPADPRGSSPLLPFVDGVVTLSQ